MRAVTLLYSAAAMCVFPCAEHDRPDPVVLRICLDNKAITPVSAHFIDRAIQAAEDAQAQCLVVALDTPGGLLDSTQEIVKDIIASRVPVVVYVSPSGARAASAGVFIALSGHVAGMAPGTRIGAAHPVKFGESPIGPSQPSPDPSDDEQADRAKRPSSAMQEKIVNDTKAWARGLARLRNRNEQWAEHAVEESATIIASEAVQQRVIDLVAADLKDLLDQIDGRQITLQAGSARENTVRIRTANAEVITLQMWWGERLLEVISNPNTAMLLLMFGFYGVLYELFSPGWGVSGTLGVISLVLAFFGLSILPINYAGLALIIVALALFAAEPFFASHGALTAGGLVCLILGGTMLVDSPTGFMRVSLAVLIPIAVGTALIVVFLVSRIIKAQRSGVRTGMESMQGTETLANNTFQFVDQYYRGRLLVHGECWNARCVSPVEAGETVRIDGQQGLTLLVSRNGRRQRIESEASEDKPDSA